LLQLQTLDDGRKLAQDLIRLLVVLHLSSDELRQVAEGFGGIQDLDPYLSIRSGRELSSHGI